jgi:glycine/D-amino acid oxidase-like deaminating enzyme
MHYAYAPEVQMAVLGYKFFSNWEETVGRPSHFRRTGFVYITKREYADRLQANVSMQRDNGANTQIISAAELKEMEPGWNTDDFDIAAYEPDSGYGDGAATASDFLSRAREMGVEYQPQTFTKSIDVEAGRVVGITTDRGEISAGTVVIATGPWTQPLLAPHGVALPIESEFHVVAMLKNPPGMEGRGLTCIDDITETYLRREGSDMTLVGDYFGERGADPDDFPQSSSAEEMAKMVGSTCHRVPALEEAGVARSVTGIYDMSPDTRPMLGRVPGLDGAYCAIGLSGMGFKLCPAVGIAMSELMLDGKGTSVDIQSFAPSRFADGKPIKAAHEYA